MKYKLLTTSAIAALAIAAQSQNAFAGATLVSTIDGAYDNTAVGPYDTPSLAISNTTGYSFTNVTLTLTPYQPGTDTYGLTPQTRSFADVGAGTVENIVWTDGYGGTIQGDLFSYDYDDSYGQTTTNPACDAQGQSLCSDVGNFKVTFTATWLNPAFGPSGTEIFSVFSPTTNASGGFVGWEGLDPNGFSESTYDDHVSTPTGVLANIYVGAPGVPEPATWAMMMIGFAGLGAAMRSRRKPGAVTA
jgi:hypothetical protein